MSDHSRIAIVLGSMQTERAASVMGRSLAVLLDEYQFGFRGRGSVLRLVFDRDQFRYEDMVSENFSSVTDVDAETIGKLVERYHWFGISGSMRIAGRARLYDLALFLYPTFDPARPACIVFRVDSSLYHDVYDEDDEFDRDAADTLFRLTVRLGADDQVDAFRMALVSSLADIRTFDGPALRRSLLEPTRFGNLSKGVAPSQGLVTGINSLANSSDEIDRIKEIWTDTATLETVNRFVVLNHLVDTDESLDDDEVN